MSESAFIQLWYHKISPTRVLWMYASSLKLFVIVTNIFCSCRYTKTVVAAALAVWPDSDRWCGHGPHQPRALYC